MVAKPELRDHNGPCQAVLRWGTPCSCFGYEYHRTVAGYRDCVCGHSQGIHSLGAPTPELKEFMLVNNQVCPTCGQPLPTEEAPS
jgi:hypothetical protein